MRARERLPPPETAGPFVALGNNRGKDEARTFHNLLTGKKIGELRGELQAEKYSLSPEGTRFAALTGSGETQKVVVYDVSSGKPQTEVQAKFDAHSITLVTPDTLAIEERRSIQMMVFDLKAKKEVSSFRVHCHRHPPAFSPGGKYVAMTHGLEYNAIWSLETGLRTLHEEASSTSVAVDCCLAGLEHGFGTVTQVTLVQAFLNPALATGQPLAYSGIHSKSFRD